MKCKRLLLMLLVALLAPWAAMAQQTLTVCDGTDNSQYVPFEGYNADAAQHNQMIFPATDLTAMNGKAVTQMVFYIDQSASNGSNTSASRLGTWTVSLGETSATTLSGLDNTTTLTQVYQGYFDCSSGTLTLPFTDGYTYHGGNLLVDLNHAAAGWNRWYFLGVNQSGVTAITRGSNYQFLPKTTFTYETPPTCPKPIGLTCSAYTANTATLSWTESGTATDWVLEYGTASDFTGATPVNVSTNPTTQLTGLTAETTYYARVKTDCGDGDQSDWSNVCEFKPSAALYIGNGTSTGGSTPLVGNYKSSYDQMIYTASQLQAVGINAAGSITKIGFNSSAANTIARNVKIYMGHTDKTSFSNNTDFIVYNDLTLVYDYSATGNGQWNITAGWNEFELDTPFDYDGNSNLVIAMHCGLASDYSSSYFYYTATSSNQVVYAYSDSYDPVPSTFDPSSYSGSKATTTQLPNLKLFIEITSTPKPRNIQVNNITASQATVSWVAPATGTPTGYEYQIKVSGNEWPTSWTSVGNNLSAEPTGLSASTDYVVRVRAVYDESESGSIETEFRTLDACAFPTNFTATTVPGVGTDANFSWVKGYDETAWNLQLATDVDFNNVVTAYFTDDGFVVDGNNVTFHATGLTPERTYFARVQADCGSGSTSVWSNVETFTPSNYVDFNFRDDATSYSYYAPFYYYTTYTTNQSQFVIPASELVDLTGGTIRSITYYTSSTATTDWGGVEFDVYMTEVQDNTFSSATFIDWATLGSPVYSGTVSLSNQKMIITFDNNYAYNGGNLLIGFKNKKAGTSTTSMSWTAYNGSTYYEVHQYGTNSATRSYYQPKITFNYQPTPYKKPVIDEANCTAGTTSAHIAWTVTGATPTSYQYQYKPASATEWPSAWTSVTTAYADLSDLTPGSSYDFRVKALYDGGNESVVVDYSFFTECDVITAFPWSEKFETYSAGDFIHPCWVNEHISGEGTYIFKVNTSTNGSNTTHQLELPDQTAGTETMLRLPEMNLPSNDYQFVIDVFRNAYTYSSYPYQLEGIHVYVSTNGNLEGATELAYIPRHKDVSNTLIPAEEVEGWYTYEIPIGISGNCYIILKGVNQYCTATYMDNLTVEQISTCARPSELASSNVTNHSATIEWTAGDAEQALWQIAYSKTNFDPNTANFDVTTVTTVTTIDANAHPFTLDKILDAASTYYVYVRANCGTAADPDFGPWSRKGVSFTTDIACPNPTSLTYSNVKSTSVELRWVGHGEEAWLLEYQKGSDSWIIQEVFDSQVTHEDGGVVVYKLDILDPETEYCVKVRANCEASYAGDGQSAYSNEECFTTTPSCAVEHVTVSDITHYTANVSWDGESADGFTVEYRTAAGNDGSMLNEDFSSLTSGIPANWDNSEGTTTSDSYKWTYYSSGHEGAGLRFNSYYNYTGNTNFLKTPAMNFPAGKTAQLVFWWKNPTGGDFSVYISTDGGTTKTALKEGLTGQTDWKEETINLTGYEGASNVTIHFKGTSNYGNGDAYIYLDEVVIGVSLDPGTEQTVSATDSPANLENLEAGKKYDVKVIPDCDATMASEWVSFTTVSPNEKWFITEGNWGTASNWEPEGAPNISQNVTLMANATIESTCVAEAKSINGTGTGTNAKTLTIKDGGRLKHLNSNVRATVEKVIRAYSTNYNAETYNNGNYYLIANPLTSTVTPDAENNHLLSGNYDLYRWDYTQDLEWLNYKASVFSLGYGAYGYLYANEAGATLTYTGIINPYTSYKDRYCSVTSNPDNYDFPGWYLLGNPYLYDAYLATAGTNGTALPYIKMNSTGDGFTNVSAGTAIEPMEGFFYQTDATKDVYVVTTAPAAKNSKLNMNLRRNNKQLDNAILVFGGDQQLGKMTFRENSSKIFMPVEGKDYAITSVEGHVGEIPVSFKAESNGTYSLSFTSEEVTFSYLHLIDNMTGADVNLLQTPSYTFDARTTDYASRFKLVFAVGNSANDETFGFVNASGNFCIFGIEGEATVQVIDVLGHMLSSETFSGSYERKINGAPGVYMVRLIQGNDVKVQKVVVR